MRNIRQYPITREEVLAVVEKIPMYNPPGTSPDEIKIGGLNDMIRHHVIKLLQEDPKVMASVLRTMQ